MPGQTPRIFAFSNSILENVKFSNCTQYNFKGFLVRFQQVYGGDITPPIFVINHVDSYTWQYYCKVVSDMIVK